MNYQAFLLDLDGVITDSERLHAVACQKTLKNYGHTVSDEQYKTFFAGKTDMAGFTHFLSTVGEETDAAIIIRQKSQVYLKIAAEHLTLCPGVVELISSSASRNIPLALVTGSLRVEAEIALKTFDLTHYFATIITADEITNSKPSPEGYLKAAATLGVAPAKCVVVEDAPSGIAAAKAAGMKCLAVTTTHAAQELSEADIVIDRLYAGCIELL